MQKITLLCVSNLFKCKLSKTYYTKVNLTSVNHINFEDIALETFRFQAKNNVVYAKFIELLNKNPEDIDSVSDIPFLPVDFFKSHEVKTGDFEPEQIFLSSGTSLQQRSRHFVADLKLYRESFIKCFEQFYGKIEECCILALLPSYLENKQSSLIYMVDTLIKMSEKNGSCYLLGKDEETIKILKQKQHSGKNTILIGVTYALMDLAEKFPGNYSNIIFMETGGMKGRRKEITRNELHSFLTKSFNVKSIHSEYGMSELLSQAYSKGDGIFHCPRWMKVLTRPLNEPFGRCKSGETGIIQIIDLANYHSCSFIETADLGKVFDDGSFEVIGRVDYAEIRGCNLLVQ